MNLRILIADHQRSFRDSLSAMLRKDPNIDTVNVVADGEELLATVVRTMPDIVCLDIDMPQLDSVGATRSLLAARPEMKVIALSATADLPLVLALLDAGAAGFMSKKGGWKPLLRGILGVGRHLGTYLGPESAAEVLPSLRQRHLPAGEGEAERAGERSEAMTEDTTEEGAVAGGGKAPPAAPVRHEGRPFKLVRELPPAAPQPGDDARFGQLVAASPVPTFAIDREHRLTCWNRACETLTGLPAASVLGRREHWRRAFCREERPLLADRVLDWLAAAEPSSAAPESCRRMALPDEAYECEDFAPGIGDAGRWLYFTAAPLRDAEGALSGVVGTLQDITGRHLDEMALKASEERYRALSITDSQTGLFNSRHFYEQVKGEIGRALRYRHPLSLISIDVDNFRRFNDTYGPLEGDRMLERLATVIRNCLRQGDSAYRRGGKEFAVLLPETELDCARKAAERLRQAFAALPFSPWTHLPRYSAVSMGVARYAQCEDFADFIRRADDGAAAAKAQGGDRIVAAVPADAVSAIVCE